jgi:hypothetical protein
MKSQLVRFAAVRLGAARFGAVSALGALACLAVDGPASAQDSYRASYRAEYANYSVEVEPHFTFGPDNVYGNSGYGGGLRLSLPLFGGYLGNVPDNLAISFGGDIVHYDNCYYNDECGANYLMFPIAAQWNIFVLHRLSLFLEGGAYVYKGFYDGCAPGDGPGCSPPSDFGVLPTIAIGGRVHFGPGTALTARFGYPTTTIGFSFM